MLELDDIQHIVMSRVPALTGRYEFLSFREPSQARSWLAGVLDKIASARGASSPIESDRRWVATAFTWNGLRAFGLPDASLVTFPEEFRQGMVERASML